MPNVRGTKHRVKAKGEANKSRKELAVWSDYRLTLAEYEALLANGCSICGSMENLCVDHDHKCCPRVNPATGKRTNRTCGQCIRGVLCRRHNLAEGHLNGDLAEVQALLDYLTR